MKRTALLALSIILILMLCACGGGNAPKNSLVEKDINSALSACNSSFSVKKLELELSSTENNIYTATYRVLVNAKYSEQKYDTTVKYKKYDQGWVAEDISLNLVESKINEQWKADLDTIVTNAFKIANPDLSSDNCQVSVTDYWADYLYNQGDGISVCYTVQKEWKHHIQFWDCTNEIIYNQNNDTWFLKSNASLTNGMEGNHNITWFEDKNYDFSGDWSTKYTPFRIIISNCSTGEMDVQVLGSDNPRYSFNGTLHFTKTPCTAQLFGNTDFCYSCVYDGAEWHLERHCGQKETNFYLCKANHAPETYCGGVTIE